MSVAPAASQQSSPAAKPWRHAIPIGSRLQVIQPSTLIVGFLAVVAHAPLVLAHVHRLSSQPQYQCFPLILAGAGLLAWRVKPEIRCVAPSSRCLTGLISVAWLTLASAVILSSAWLGMLAALLLVCACGYTRGGSGYVKSYWQAGLMFCLLFPPPLGLDQRLVANMQRLAAYSSSAMLDLLEIPHVRHGNVIETVNRNLLVEQACSGIDSLVTAVSCTLFFILWTNRPRLHSGLLLLGTVGWVLMANIVRITLVAYLDASGGIDVATGWRHQLLGAGIFLVAILLIGSTDQFFCFLLGTHEMQPSTPAPVPQTRPSPLPWPGRRLWPLGVGYGLLVMAQLGDHKPGMGKAIVPHFARIPELGSELLPVQAGSFRLKKYHIEPRETTLQTKAYSQLWEYESDRARLNCSLDYPFVGWHELSICYQETGWSIIEQSVIDDDEGQPIIQLDLRQAPGRTGLVLFQSFTGDGRPLTRPGTQGPSWRLRHGFSHILGLRTEDDPETLAGTTTYQAQLFMENSGPMTREDVKAARQLFQRALPLLRSTLAKQVGSASLSQLGGQSP